MWLHSDYLLNIEAIENTDPGLLCVTLEQKLNSDGDHNINNLQCDSTNDYQKWIFHLKNSPTTTQATASTSTVTATSATTYTSAATTSTHTHTPVTLHAAPVVGLATPYVAVLP